MKKSPSILLTALPLLLICALCALLVASVNFITADRIAENENKMLEDTLAALYPEGKNMAREEVNEPAFALCYRYLDESGTCAYAAVTLPQGFAQEIRLCTVVSAKGEVIGVRVLSAEETPGLGDQACKSEYLDSYAGVRAPVILGENVDAISGATVSSTAISDSVNLVLETVQKLEGGKAS